MQAIGVDEWILLKWILGQCVRFELDCFDSEEGPMIGCGENGDVTSGTVNGKGI